VFVVADGAARPAPEGHEPQPGRCGVAIRSGAGSDLPEHRDPHPENGQHGRIGEPRTHDE